MWSKAYSNTGLPRRSRRLLPSFPCFKKKKNSTRRSGFGKDSGRGGRMLRLMSSFLKKRDPEPACTQENPDEDNEVANYIVNLFIKSVYIATTKRPSLSYS